MGNNPQNFVNSVRPSPLSPPVSPRARARLVDGSNPIISADPIDGAIVAADPIDDAEYDEIDKAIDTGELFEEDIENDDEEKEKDEDANQSQ